MKKKRINLIFLSITILVVGFLFLIDYNSKDDLLAVYLDNTRSSEIPSKSGNYVIDKIVCDDDVKASWDNISWSLSVNNMNKKTKCNLYFKSKKDITITYDNNYTNSDIFSDTYYTGTMNTCCQTNSGDLYSVRDYTNGIYTFTRKPYANDTNDRGVFLPNKNKLTVGQKYYLRYVAKVAKNVSNTTFGSEQWGYSSPGLTSEWQTISYEFTAAEHDIVAFIFYDWWVKDSDNTLQVGNIFLQKGSYNNYSKVSLKEYDNLGNMPSPTRSGYTFLGWYTEALGGTRVDENTIVTENTTYYAHWQ